MNTKLIYEQFDQIIVQCLPLSCINTSSLQKKGIIRGILSTVLQNNVFMKPCLFSELLAINK